MPVRKKPQAKQPMLPDDEKTEHVADNSNEAYPPIRESVPEKTEAINHEDNNDEDPFGSTQNDYPKDSAFGDNTEYLEPEEDPFGEAASANNDDSGEESEDEEYENEYEFQEEAKSDNFDDNESEPNDEEGMSVQSGEESNEYDNTQAADTTDDSDSSAEAEGEEADETIENRQSEDRYKRVPIRRSSIQVGRRKTAEERTKEVVSFNTLVRLARMGKILSAVIVGMKPKEECLMAQIDGYEDVALIYIPFSEIDMNIQAPTDTTQMDIYRSHYRARAESMIGSHINVVVTSLERNNKVGAASNKIANRRNRRSYFYRGVLTPVAGEYETVAEGGVYNARVVSVRSKGIDVDICGALTYIPISQLGEGFIEGAHDSFANGDNINVLIEKIFRGNDSDYTVKVRATRIGDNGINPIKALAKVSVGDIDSGEITGKDKNGVLMVRTMRGYNAYMTRFTGLGGDRLNRLRPGVKVRVRVFSKNLQAANVELINIIDPNR